MFVCICLRFFVFEKLPRASCHNRLRKQEFWMYQTVLRCLSRRTARILKFGFSIITIWKICTQCSRKWMVVLSYWGVHIIKRLNWNFRSTGKDRRLVQYGSENKDVWSWNQWSVQEIYKKSGSCHHWRSTTRRTWNSDRCVHRCGRSERCEFLFDILYLQGIIACFLRGRLNSNLVSL